jgi:hypothetical protein
MLRSPSPMTGLRGIAQVAAHNARSRCFTDVDVQGLATRYHDAFVLTSSTYTRSAAESGHVDDLHNQTVIALRMWSVETFMSLRTPADDRRTMIDACSA